MGHVGQSHLHLFNKTRFFQIIIYLPICNPYKSIFILQFGYRLNYRDCVVYKTKPRTQGLD